MAAWTTINKFSGDGEVSTPLRKYLFRLLFGNDEIPQRMFSVLDLRKKAIAQHATNKALLQRLSDGQKSLTDIRVLHLKEKAALEDAYRLVLD